MEPIHERFEFKVKKCILCGSKDLTYDHVPPKFLDNKGVYELKSYPYTGSSKTAIDGVKFRTVCKKCNNENIQNIESTILSPLAKEIKRCLKFGLIYKFSSNPITLSLNPKKLCKLISAKILIMSMIDFDSIVMEESKTKKSYFRELWEFYHGIANNNFVFDIWIHESKHLNIFPLISLVLDWDRNNVPIMSSVLSFYPLGFMVFRQQNISKPNLSFLDYTSSNQELLLCKSYAKSKYFPLDILPENGVILTDKCSNFYARKIKNRL